MSCGREKADELEGWFYDYSSATYYRGGRRPKSEADQLREQIAQMSERLRRLEGK